MLQRCRKLLLGEEKLQYYCLKPDWEPTQITKPKIKHMRTMEGKKTKLTDNMPRQERPWEKLI
jgi:hypothetical protein